MRAAVFVDTSGWLPVYVVREPRHEVTVRVYGERLDRGTRLVTTNLVTAEMHALMARRLGPEVGVEFLDRLHADPAHEVRFVDRELERAAVDSWLRPFRDRRFSLTDAVSFEVMRREGIRAALAVDRHFSVAGYELLL